MNATRPSQTASDPHQVFGCNWSSVQYVWPFGYKTAGSHMHSTSLALGERLMCAEQWVFGWLTEKRWMKDRTCVCERKLQENVCYIRIKERHFTSPQGQLTSSRSMIYGTKDIYQWDRVVHALGSQFTFSILFVIYKYMYRIFQTIRRNIYERGYFYT